MQATNSTWQVEKRPGLLPELSTPARTKERTWSTPSLLLLLIVALMPFLHSLNFKPGGLQIDASDFIILPILGCALLSLIFSGKGWSHKLSDVPLIGLWTLLGIWMSIAYVNGVWNLGYLTDPFSITYQLYRYVWRPLLFYLFVFYFLRKEAHVKALILVIVAPAVLFALNQIVQARLGFDFGPVFNTFPKNAYAGYLIFPSMLALNTGFTARWKPARYFYLLSFFTLMLGYWYLGSRGAMIAVLFGVMVFSLFAERQQRNRFIGVSLLLMMAVLLFKPNFGANSGIRYHFLAALEGSDEGNMSWRTEQRWPHFMEKVKQHPFIGVGSDVDYNLGYRGNTPHNGYLSIAVTAGIPALIMMLLLIFRYIRLGLQMRRGRDDEFHSNLSVGLISGLSAILLHSTVDSTISGFPMHEFFWMMFAIIAIWRTSKQWQKEPLSQE